MDRQIHAEAEPLFNLNSDTSHNWDDSTKGRAPHKPLLLLSILDGMEQNWITSKYIELNQLLIETFFEYWNALMGKEKVTSIALPFYHMQSEAFWTLHYKAGAEEYRSSPSLGGLMNRVKYAEINSALFELLTDSERRNMIRGKLISAYFSEDAVEKLKKISRFNSQAYKYAVKLEEFAEEDFQVDHSNEKGVKYRTSKTQVRDAGFSKTVRKAYQYTCAVCRDRVITPSGNTLVEGAHIIPRSTSNNDDPRNGIALCKTHHWMFDQYLMTIKPDHTIVLSKWLKEETNHVKYLWDFNKKPILLPEKDKYYPAPEALEIHFASFKEVQ